MGWAFGRRVTRIDGRPVGFGMDDVVGGLAAALIALHYPSL